MPSPLPPQLDLKGTFVNFDAPAINDWDEVAFVATVRRGRETFQALYLYTGGKLRKLAAEGERLPPPNLGTFDKFGVPAINNKGVKIGRAHV